MSVRKSIKDYLKEDIEDISKLLSLALKKSKEQLFSNPNYELNNIELKALDKLIEQRNDGKPFAYLKGSQGFYDLNFIVSSATLIPRPETELLIDITLDTFDINTKINALDLGTGSGVIAITLSEKYPNWSISATDQSKAALKIAQLNTNKNINFYHGNWFDPLPKEKFDLIVSNPPYINDHDPHLKSLSYEPIEALISGSDGLDDIRKIILQAPQFLNQAGYLLLEHGYNQKNHIIDLLKESPKHLTITGGEPTLLGERLVLLINKILEKFPDLLITILSNGRLLALENTIDTLSSIKLKKNVVFAIPLYSDVYKVHDHIVQAKDAFHQTCLGIHKISSLGFPVEIRVVLHKLSNPRLLSLSKFIHKNFPFVYHVTFMGLEIIGYTKANKLELIEEDHIMAEKNLLDSLKFLSSWKYNISIYNTNGKLLVSSSEKTLNEDDLNKINQTIITAVESKLDAKIRS